MIALNNEIKALKPFVMILCGQKLKQFWQFPRPLGKSQVASQHINLVGSIIETYLENKRETHLMSKFPYQKKFSLIVIFYFECWECCFP